MIFLINLFLFFLYHGILEEKWLVATRAAVHGQETVVTILGVTSTFLEPKINTVASLPYILLAS